MVVVTATESMEIHLPYFHYSLFAFERLCHGHEDEQTAGSKCARTDEVEGGVVVTGLIS